MSDSPNSHKVFTPIQGVISPWPFEAERRMEQDRRQTARHGKYDRRRNRCVHCLHFEASDSGDKGLCLVHRTETDAGAFTCTRFEVADL